MPFKAPRFDFLCLGLLSFHLAYFDRLDPQFQGRLTRFQETVFAGPSRTIDSSGALPDLPRSFHFLIYYSFTFLAARTVILGEINMVITLPPELEIALNELARKRGVAPEILALDALRERLIAMTRVVEPRDEWERLVIQTGTNCGVSLPNEALGSEGLYESWLA